MFHQNSKHKISKNGMLLMKIITLLNLDHQMHQKINKISNHIIHFESSKFNRHKKAKMESNYSKITNLITIICIMYNL